MPPVSTTKHKLKDLFFEEWPFLKYMYERNKYLARTLLIFIHTCNQVIRILYSHSQMLILLINYLGTRKKKRSGSSYNTRCMYCVHIGRYIPSITNHKVFKTNVMIGFLIVKLGATLASLLSDMFFAFSSVLLSQ